MKNIACWLLAAVERAENEFFAIKANDNSYYWNFARTARPNRRTSSKLPFHQRLHAGKRSFEHLPPLCDICIFRSLIGQVRNIIH